MNATPDPSPPRSRPRGSRLVAALAAIALTVVGLAIAAARSDAGPTAYAAHRSTAHAAGTVSGQSAAATSTVLTPAKLALHDEMRRLWEDHVTWTRLAIVAFVDGSAGFDASAARLLRNQEDIGAAIAPYYGAAAGEQLTGLLHDHITIAVEVLQAAKVGDTAALADARARWYVNANEIADFLSAANPGSWPQADLRDAMRMHLDQTLAEAVAELSGDYPASVAAYDEIHHHILSMADLLSSGLFEQFPSRFH